jgi:6-phosphogluconolactonase
LAAKSENPSFLCLSHDKKFLVAVNEINVDNNGTVESYRVDGEKLKLINKQNSGGAHPCFIAVNDQGFVLTANYTGGNMGLLKINEKGELSKILDLEQHKGNGPTPRQASPHVHSAWFEKNGNDIISVDLGTDALYFSTIDKSTVKFKQRDQKSLKMKDGAGPRHLTIHPMRKWIYVLNELDCTVTQVLKSQDGRYSALDSYSTLPEGFTGSNTCADIHITNDGKFLYSSNRGHNSIAIFSIHEKNGSLTLISNIPTLGKNPRNFAISPDEKYLLVANQTTENIVSFKRDKRTGLLTYISETPAPKPVCILFW